MKFPAPNSQALSRADLLKDVRAELRRRYPAVADLLDVPGDPGWMLVEQIAFMAEALSASLDEQPRAVVAYFLSLLGRELRPATPALGIVSVQAETAGTLDTLDGLEDRADPPRLIAPATDRREQVQYAFVERKVPLRPGGVIGLFRLERGRLVGRYIRGASFPDDQVAWRTVELDLDLLEKELITFHIERKPDEALKGVAQRLVDAYADDGPAALGWLQVRRVMRDERMEIRAEIDPNWPFPRTGESRRARRWGRLHGWRPRIEPHTKYDALRLTYGIDGMPLLMGCPPDVDTGELLSTLEPAPADLPDILWKEFRSLLGEAAALLPISPIAERDAQAPAATPEWLSPLPYEAHWVRLNQSSGLIAALQFQEFPKGETFRVAVVFDALLGDERAPSLEVLEPDGSVWETKPSYTLPLPLPVALGPQSCAVAVYDVKPNFPREDGVIIVHAPRQRAGAAPPRAIFLNPAAIINAALDWDGRSVDVGRGPGEVDLLWQDIVGEDVKETLASSMPDAAARPMKRLLAEFQLAAMTVLKNDKVIDRLSGWDALVLDSVEGRARFGLAADAEQRRLVGGSTLQLDWYRHGNGLLGNLGAGAISQLQQARGQEPSATGVHNPLPTSYGQEAETTDQAMARLFGPERGAIPSVPADLERIARQALGAAEQNWVLRVWTHAERIQLASNLWGLTHGPEWSRRIAEEGDAKLDELGPRAVAVALGNPSGEMDQAAFVSMASAVRARVRSIGDRVPHIEDCVVLPFHPLQLVSTDEVDDYILPSFRPPAMPFGALRPAFDEDAKTEAMPGIDLWLDAAVVRAEQARPVVDPVTYEPDAPGFAEMKIVDW